MASTCYPGRLAGQRWRRSASLFSRSGHAPKNNPDR